jgi:molybdopterin-guanine dinucleotide biosynthesis protein A
MLAAIVLAGGTASRLGGIDKPLARLGQGTVLAAILSRLQPQVQKIAISANGDPARFASFGLPVIADDVEGEGPLRGVLAGMRFARDAGCSVLLTVPGDTPFIPTNLVARLGTAPAHVYSQEFTHGVIALWQCDNAKKLAELLSQGERRVRAALTVFQSRAVDFSDSADAFFNINTLHDLAEANARFNIENTLSAKPIQP